MADASVIDSNGGTVWIGGEDLGSCVVGVRVASGSIIRAKCDVFQLPLGMVSDGNAFWITDAMSNALTELNGTTGRIIRTLSN